MPVKKKVKKTKAVKKTVKKAVKKPAKAKRAVKAKAVPAAKTVAYPKLQSVGKITHYFPHVFAGVVKLTGELNKGDIIQIKGHTTDFKQTVGSMQLEHEPIAKAGKGLEIGIKVKERVRIGDLVYKI